MATTHRADGLYFLNINILKNRLACENQRRRWYLRFRNRNIPITLEVVREMHNNFDRCVAWAASTMFHNGLVSCEHYNRFLEQYRGAFLKPDCEAECKAFMNLLRNRARREADIRKAAA